MNKDIMTINDNILDTDEHVMCEHVMCDRCNETAMIRDIGICENCDVLSKYTCSRCGESFYQSPLDSREYNSCVGCKEELCDPKRRRLTDRMFSDFDKYTTTSGYCDCGNSLIDNGCSDCDILLRWTCDDCGDVSKMTTTERWNYLRKLRKIGNTWMGIRNTQCESCVVKNQPKRLTDSSVFHATQCAYSGMVVAIAIVTLVVVPYIY